jgi:hypothetical protein
LVFEAGSVTASGVRRGDQSEREGQAESEYCSETAHDGSSECLGGGEIKTPLQNSRSSVGSTVAGVGETVIPNEG